MSTQATLSTTNTRIALKGGMFTLTTIQILNPGDELFIELDEKIKQAPNFFLYAPVVLDFQKLRPADEEIDLQWFIHNLRTRKLIPIGIRGASKVLKDIAIQAGLAIFPEDKLAQPPKKSTQTEKAKPLAPSLERNETPAAPTASPTRVITQPVRSGQQIYAAGGDLIVFASVGHGAELLADGHIHVYGTLRGRALAGVKGNKEAMIFCRSLEAELISIAGQYRLSEDLKETCWQESACIQLIDERLQIRPV